MKHIMLNKDGRLPNQLCLFHTYDSDAKNALHLRFLINGEKAI